MLANRRVWFGLALALVTVGIISVILLGGTGLHIQSDSPPMSPDAPVETHSLPTALEPVRDIRPNQDWRGSWHKPYKSTSDTFFFDKNQRSRWESAEVWRDPERVPDNIPRVKQPSPGSLIRPLSADYLHPLVNDIFLLFKTGADIMWNRIPTHLHTTLTRFPNFALYSDRPGTVAGYEVIDILKDIPSDVLNDYSLKKYRIMRQMQEDGWMWDAKDISMSEGWEMDRYKNIPMLLHAYLTAPPNTQWFLMIDDDTYILSSNIAQFLDTLDSSKAYYIGSVAQVSIPFAHGGSGVILSRGAMDAIFGPHAKRPNKEMVDKYAAVARTELLGDYMIALLLSREANIWVNTLDSAGKNWPAYDMFESGQDMFQGQEIWNTWLTRELWCYPVGTFHHERPHDLEVLWEWEQSRASSQTFLTFYDFYRDFIQPYAAEEIKNWAFNEEGDKLDAEKLEEDEVWFEGNIIFPNETVVDCKHTCSSRENCFAWSFKPGECHIYDGSFTRGVGTHPNYEKYAEEWTSGFNIEHIRNMRAEQSCDPLGGTPSDGQGEPGDRKEGWFWREKLQAEGN